MVGTLRINAILMTILPLVVSKLVVSVAGQTDGRAHGRAGRRAVFAPVPTAAGLPVEAMGVLLAVDPIPKAFRTVSNVTGMLASTVLAGGRRQTAHSSERPGEEQP
jgi:Na+/H+-dicarboxylate symporter